MLVLLIVAQVVLLVLEYGAHILKLNPWLLWLPMLVLGVLVIVNVLVGGVVLSALHKLLK